MQRNRVMLLHFISCRFLPSYSSLSLFSLFPRTIFLPRHHQDVNIISDILPLITPSATIPSLHSFSPLSHSLSLSLILSLSFFLIPIFHDEAFSTSSECWLKNTRNERVSLRNHIFKAKHIERKHLCIKLLFCRIYNVSLRGWRRSERERKRERE